MRLSDDQLLPGAIAIAIASMLLIAVSASPLLRAIVGLPLVLVLPGYAILRAAFSRRWPTMETAIFSVGLSLSATVILGFVLSVFDSMTPLGWAFGLGVTTIAAAVVARSRPADLSFRPSDLPDDVRADADPAASRALRMPANGRSTAIVASAVLLVIGAVTLSLAGARASREFAYTDFWIVRSAGGLGEATIGIENHERAAGMYDVDLMVDDRLAAMWRAIPLEVGESWTVNAPVALHPRQRAEAWLFKDGNRQRVYRKVWLAGQRTQ